MKGAFRGFSAFFALLRCPGVERHFFGALDGEEFFVVEGSPCQLAQDLVDIHIASTTTTTTTTRGLPEQVIEVPRVTLQDVVPLHAALREPQLAEKVAEVPVPEVVILARGTSALGLDWCHVAAQGRGFWWQTGTRHVRSDPPPASTASPGRYINTGQG